METRNYWEENGHGVKYENYNSNDGFPSRGVGCADQLNFNACPSDDEADYQAAGYLKKGKVSRQDPMSHRIIEKRRRDRMNNCLADLSRLIPPEYLKKGRGRVEKTEIIEMAIRHIKYLQERANGLYTEKKVEPDYAAERQTGSDSENYRAGFQEAIAEAVRFLVEIQGCGPRDALCVQLTTHLQRHCEHMTKGDQIPPPAPREKMPSHIGGSSSETASSSSPSSAQGYAVKPVVISRIKAPPEPPPTRYEEPYETSREPIYHMECDRVSGSAVSLAADDSEAPSSMNGAELLPLDGRRNREPTLRTIRKPEHNENYLHSYKFKNSIERRFSRSQDNEVHDMSVRSPHGKVYTHKRRRAAKPAPSASTSNSGSTEDARDTSPQDTSSESAHNHYEKPTLPTQYVPVFALNALGKYYVPLSVDYSCLARHLGPYDALDARTAHMAAPLHPVTIHVNFQPCHYRLKREPNEREWRNTIA